MAASALRLDHVSLAVTDIDSGIAFFEQGLGLTLAFLEREMTDQIASMLGRPDATCDIAQLDIPGGAARLELIGFRMNGEPPDDSGPHPIAPAQGHAAFRAPDFDSTLDRLAALGARPLGKVTEFSNGRSVYLLTPVGAVIEIEEERDATA